MRCDARRRHSMIAPCDQGPMAALLLADESLISPAEDTTFISSR
jgi:hypothetical protein